jgi:dipeptidyl aminopeptidase/acylaminoacyl peptidase
MEYIFISINKLIIIKMTKVLKNLFTLNFIFIFSSIPLSVFADGHDEMIPIEKLVCYGQGASTSLSPSGNFIAAMVSLKDNVCEIDEKEETDKEAMKVDRVLVVTDLNTMEPKVLSGTTPGSSVSSFSWLNEETLLVSRAGGGGFAGANLYTINKDGSDTTLIMEAKRFKNKPGIKYPAIYSTYPKYPNKIMITVNRNSNYRIFRDLYWLDLNTKQTKLVARVPSIDDEGFAGWIVDWDGVARGFSTYDDDGDNKGLVRSFYEYNQDSSYTKLGSCMHQEACFSPVRFDIDNKTVLGVGQAVLQDGSILNETDTNALWGFDMDTKEFTEMIYHDPDFDISSPLQGDSNLGLWFQADGSDLYGFSYQAEKTTNVYFNNHFASVSKSLEGAFPDHEVSINDWSNDLTKFLFSISNERDPGSLYMFDTSKGSLALIKSYAPWLKDYKLATTKPFTYKARDGLKLHGYITFPADYKEGSKIPFILHPHGGPNARDYFGYNPEVQFYASRGYGVIQPNYRGSTGHGRKEMILANHEMGKTMQTDKYDALFWARDMGYVDMDNICISGASYGGYAAMHAATKEPDLFKCVITYVGTYDLTSMDLRGLQWSDVGMPMEYIEKGNPENSEDYKNLYDNSPIFFVENVKAPVLIITGRRDTQVRFQETVDMVNKFKQFDVDYEYIIKGDEGHGFRKETTRLELYKDYEKFLKKYLD